MISTRRRVALARRSGSERGSVSILAAGVMYLAAALSLVGVDLLRVLEAKARAQAAADAAALAAAQELAIPSEETPRDLAADYATRNGASLLSCRCEPGGTEAIVEVVVDVPLIFVGASRTVRSAARAVVETGSRGPPG